MARLKQKQSFLALGQFVARKSFPFNGEQHNPGDEFDWEKLGCTEDKLRKMVASGHLQHKMPTKDDVLTSKKAPIKLVEKETVPVEEPADEVTDDEEVVEPKKPDPVEEDEEEDGTESEDETMTAKERKAARAKARRDAKSEKKSSKMVIKKKK